MTERSPFLIITGTVGVGKTTVGEAISDILGANRVAHAFIDRDAVSRSWPPSGRFNEDLAIQNVASCWNNFRAAGAQRLVMAGVIEHRNDLDRYREAVAPSEIVLCRIRASWETRVARLSAREEGESLKRHLARTVELDQILDEVALEDHSFENEGRPLHEVANEILVTIGWV